MSTDKRYTRCREFCGYDTPRHVVRFCGDFIVHYATAYEAEQAIVRLIAIQDTDLTRNWHLLDNTDEVYLYKTPNSEAWRVAYGAQVTDHTTAEEAYKDFVVCIRHSLACAGVFDDED